MVLHMTDKRKEEPSASGSELGLEQKLELNTKEIIINLRSFNMDHVSLQDITDLINSMNEVVASQDRKIRFYFKCCIQED